MASLSLEGIQKVYSNGFQAVKDFNLEIAPDVENQQHFV